MDTLKFIFYIGIAFTVFQMLWWMLNGLISYATSNKSKTLVPTYILKALHYLILMPTLVGFINLKADQGKISADSQILYISITVAVTLMYLFGKIQKRQRLNRFRKSLNQVFNNSIPPFSFKWEIILSIAAIAMLAASFFVPELYQNGFIAWITKAIASIYDAFIIGFIFRIIGIVFVISLFWKLIVGIRSLFGYNPDDHRSFNVHVEQDEHPQNSSSIDGDVEYTEYEEIEEDEATDD